MEPVEEKSNTWRDIVSVLTLFYLPPIGVIIMWFLARWSALTKWIVTILVGIVPLILVGTMSFGGYKFVKFQQGYTPVLGVQQALDVYGLKNGKYPSKLDDLKPDYVKELPTDANLDYQATEDGKSYTLKAKVEGKDVELRPVFTNLPATSS